MKSTTAIVLLSVYLITATGFGELLKMGLLVEHYNQTKCCNASLSFLEFLEMHYVTDDSNNNDNAEDKNLPFKSPETLLDIISQDIICYNPPSIFNNLIILSGTKKIHLNESHINHYHPVVWHPPQL